ncbi:MAG: DUF559 domain-containing protein [Deltaproteobacteria bacterium]|nr:DUF559 domain-containing protein [Deltaproteobacteria bacterium]
MLPYNKSLKYASRKLRSNMTDAELALWSRIRDGQILNIQFYRQKPIADFIVDFYAPKAQVVIELDGGQHQEENQKEVDKQRDADLSGLGLKALRFNNWQVLKETEAVVEKIYQIVERQLKSPLHYRK